VSARTLSVLAVQLLTLAGVVVTVAVVQGPRAFVWLALVLALSVVVGFVAQIVVGEQQGFVGRSAATATGSLGIVALGALAATLLGA
jgi:hypothetical protein